MIDVNNQPDLESVLDALSTPPVKPERKTSSDTEIVEMSEDDIYNFVVNQLKETIEANAEVLEQSRDMVSQIGDAAVLESHSKIVKSQADLLTNLVSTMMEKKKLAQADKHKTRDLDLKEKALAEKKPYGDMQALGTTNIQNNFLMANRDDLFDSLFEKDPNKKQKAVLKIKEANGISENISEAIDG